MINERQLRDIQNRHALQTLNTRVEIPDVNLGIGFAENLAPYKMSLIQINKNEKVIIPRLDELPVEQVMLDAEGHIFNESDFGYQHYLGDMVGGI